MEIYRKGRPYIPEDVLEGKVRFVIYIPYQEYVFTFPEQNGKLVIGQGKEKVASIEGKRGPWAPSKYFRRRAFDQAYAIWKKWKEKTRKGVQLELIKGTT